MNRNWLANFFDTNREIIEAAETPFSKLVIFVLPIIAPLVPAFITGLHLYKLFAEVFTFSGASNASKVMSVVIALVMEMLGYVGAISFIQAIFRLVKYQNSLYAIPATLNGLAYIFYLLLMFLVNYQLGKYFNTPGIINVIVGLLSFVTVPTGLLAANYLSQKEIKEEDKEIRHERRDERLERYRIKSGSSKTTSRSNIEVPQQFQKSFGTSKTGRPPIHQERVFSYLEEALFRTGDVPTFTNVSKDLNLPQSTASRLRNEWIEKKKSTDE